MQFENLTYQIIGCAMKVHRILGNGFPEVIYQRALEIEFKLQQIPHIREMDMPVFYEGHKISSRRVDFYVFDQIMVELKATSRLTEADVRQDVNYLQIHNKPIGLLINFGGDSLEYKRIYNTKHADASNNK